MDEIVSARYVLSSCWSESLAKYYVRRCRCRVVRFHSAFQYLAICPGDRRHLQHRCCGVLYLSTPDSSFPPTPELPAFWPDRALERTSARALGQGGAGVNIPPVRPPSRLPHKLAPPPPEAPETPGVVTRVRGTTVSATPNHGLGSRPGGDGRPHGVISASFQRVFRLQDSDSKGQQTCTGSAAQDRGGLRVQQERQVQS